MVSEVARQRKVVIGSRIAFAVAAIEVVAVIPMCWTDSMADRDAATIAFLVNAFLTAGVGAALLAPAVRRGGRGGKALLWAAAFLGLVLGLGLLDAAFAFLGHPGMILEAYTLFLCVAGELTTAALAAAGAVARAHAVHA